MSTITLPTTLHCAGCVESIKPFFNSSDKVKDWNVDLKPMVKTITAVGEDLKQEDVVELLHKAGYDVLKTSPVSSELPPMGTKHKPAKTDAFWSDRKKWNRASFNTLNCLVGCSIGDFGTIMFLQAFFPHTAMLVQMALATIVGLCTSVILESIILRVRENFFWRLAFTTAFSMSFLSMVTMEIAMNISDFIVTGGKAAFNTPQYWLAFAIASIAGFLAPLPYNYYKLKKFNQSCH
jgi:cation transport ATPase